VLRRRVLRRIGREHMILFYTLVLLYPTWCYSIRWCYSILKISLPLLVPSPPSEDYVAYERICGIITSLSSKIKSLPPASPFRIDLTQQLLNKLHNLGVIDSKSNLEKADGISVSAFCRRRLPVLMLRLKMSQTLPSAISLIETGQVRLGPNVVTDPSFLVTRGMEDFVGWTEGGKIERSVKKYNGKLDDFDLEGNGA